MLKRVVSIIVGVACLLTMTGAFAMVTYNNTTTSYVPANGKIVVNSQITSSVAGDVTTYMVFDKEKSLSEVTGDDVVYLDQHTAAADNEAYKFTFKTDSDNIGANVAVGGNVQASGPVDNVPGTIWIHDASLQKDYFCGVVSASDDAEFVKLVYGTGTGAETPASNGRYVVSVNSGLSDGEFFLAEDGLYVSASVVADLESVLEVTLSTAEISTGVPTLATKSLRWFSGDEADTTNDGDDVADISSVVAVGSVTATEGLTKCGILLASGKDSYDALVNAFDTTTGEFGTVTGAQALEALATSEVSDGAKSFGIRVYGGFEEDETVYAMAYAVTEVDGSYVLTVAPQGYVLNVAVNTEALMLSFDEFVVDEEEEAIIFDDPYGADIAFEE